jgi:hypothetical protein
MKEEIWAQYLKSRLPWLVAAALVLCLSAPAPASAGGPDRQTVSSWASYHPKGWSAGSVVRGTGYWRPGASRRVREVQRRLVRLDYPTGKVDGFFGPITAGAVRQYQGDHALVVDGIVGPRTLHDLRTRTRRGQGSVDRQTSTSKPGAKAERNALKAVWNGREATSSPRWWTLVPLLAAAFAIVLVAAGLLLPALAGRATSVPGRGRRGRVTDASPSSEPEIVVRQAEPGTARRTTLLAADEGEQALEAAAIADLPAFAAVTAIGSRRRKSRRAGLVAAHDAGGPGELRIVRRVEQMGARSGGGRPKRATPSGRPPKEDGDRSRFSVFGARIHLARAQPIDLPGQLLVELELFVEGDRRRWETGIIGSVDPFRVSLDNLEESVRALVVPDYLPAVADALAEAGLEVGPEELIKLTFAIEPTIEVERVMAGRSEVFPIAG